MRYSKLNIWGVLSDVSILLNARFSANLTNSKNFGDSIRVFDICLPLFVVTLIIGQKI